MQENITLDWQTTSKHLFNQPLKLFNRIRDSPFTRGLPTREILQQSATARVFKKAIAEDGIVKRGVEKESEEFKALQDIWRNGWLHAAQSKIGVRYIFATQIHRW